MHPRASFAGTGCQHATRQPRTIKHPYTPSLQTRAWRGRAPRLLVDVLKEELDQQRMRSLVRQQPVVQQVGLEARHKVLPLLQPPMQAVQRRLRAAARPAVSLAVLLLMN